MSTRPFIRCGLCIFAALFLFGGQAFGQSNEVIDSVLDQESLETSYAAYLVFTAADMLPDSAPPAEAAEMLGELKGEWKLKNYAPEKPITLGQYSYLIMRAFSIKGGLFYRLIPGPRYAVRELAYLKLIREDPVSGRTVSGEEAVRILGNTLEWLDSRS